MAVLILSLMTKVTRLLVLANRNFIIKKKKTLSMLRKQLDPTCNWHVLMGKGLILCRTPYRAYGESLAFII